MSQAVHQTSVAPARPVNSGVPLRLGLAATALPHNPFGNLMRNSTDWEKKEIVTHSKLVNEQHSPLYDAEKGGLS